jgi:hypothetical protein
MCVVLLVNTWEAEDEKMPSVFRLPHHAGVREYDSGVDKEAASLSFSCTRAAHVVRPDTCLGVYTSARAFQSRCLLPASSASKS